MNKKQLVAKVSKRYADARDSRDEFHSGNMYYVGRKEAFEEVLHMLGAETPIKEEHPNALLMLCELICNVENEITKGKK